MHSSHNPIVQCIQTISKESINNVPNHNEMLMLYRVSLMGTFQ